MISMVKSINPGSVEGPCCLRRWFPVHVMAECECAIISPNVEYISQQDVPRAHSAGLARTCLGPYRVAQPLSDPLREPAIKTPCRTFYRGLAAGHCRQCSRAPRVIVSVGQKPGLPRAADSHMVPIPGISDRGTRCRETPGETKVMTATPAITGAMLWRARNAAQEPTRRVVSLRRRCAAKACLIHCGAPDQARQGKTGMPQAACSPGTRSPSESRFQLVGRIS